MKAITIWQPWATAIALEIKHNETRSWATNYRGPIAIHAAAKNDAALRGLWMDVCSEMSKAGHDYFIRQVHNKGPYYIEYRDKNREVICNLDFGAVVAIANLVECIPITPEYYATLSEEERALGDYTFGRFAWVIEDVVMLHDSIPFKGQQGIWNIDDKYLK